MKNRRKEAREFAHTSLQVYWFGPDGEMHSQFCHSFNASPSGFNVELPFALSPATKVFLVSPDIATQGTIQTIRRYGYWFRMGIAVDADSPTDLRCFRQHGEIAVLLMAAGERVIQAQALEVGACARYVADPTHETETCWYQCRAETERLFEEHRQLRRQLSQGSEALTNS